MRTPSYLITAAVAVLSFGLPAWAQTATPAAPNWLKHGSFITPGDLPSEFQASLQATGGRLMSAALATVSLSGTLTDADGTRTVQITIEAPGYLRFQDAGTSPRVLTFDGTQFQSQNGKGGMDDERIEESLMADLPDSIYLQLATGGGARRIGSRFRTDNGTTPNYTGPYWSLYAYSPAARQGLTWGQALQQSFFIALDEQTGFVSEVRMVNQSAGSQNVTQTKFLNWFQQSGQWYPGQIVRVENGQQTLSFQTQQAATGAQLSSNSIFEP
jgi:hypothetical protein